MSRRTFRLGLDYGTSTSKMIFRDPLAPGGEKAYLLRRGSEFRVSSSVLATNSDLLFGLDPRSEAATGIWYHSVKMRAAGECTGAYEKLCFGARPLLPMGISACDLAMLTIWFLAAEARRLISKRYRLSIGDVDVAFTVGVPMSFYEDTKLRRVFLNLARGARWLYDNVEAMDQGRIGTVDAVKLVGRVPNFDGDSAPDIRNWIRSEAEAAMCLPVKSPAVADGPYAEVDIGAGTTNATIFAILPTYSGQRWIKERLAFYGARSEPMGMDAFDVVLAVQRGMFATEAADLRGRETEFIDGNNASAFGPVLSGIRDSYVMAWRRAYPKLHLSEARGFRHHQVFVTGGGSLVPLIREQLRLHPSGGDDMMQTRTLEMPSDLWDFDGQRCKHSELVFLAAAYGLTFDALEVPEADTPDTMDNVVHPVRPRLNWEDM